MKKEIRIVKLNEMCVEETKSQNEKETFIMILKLRREKLRNRILVCERLK